MGRERGGKQREWTERDQERERQRKGKRKRERRGKGKIIRQRENN